MTKKLLHCGHGGGGSFSNVVISTVAGADVCRLMPYNYHCERDRAIERKGEQWRVLVMGDDGRFVCDNCAAG